MKLPSFSMYSGCDKNDPQSRIRAEDNLHPGDWWQGDKNGGQYQYWIPIILFKICRMEMEFLVMNISSAWKMSPFVDFIPETIDSLDSLQRLIWFTKYCQTNFNLYNLVPDTGYKQVGFSLGEVLRHHISLHVVLTLNILLPSSAKPNLISNLINNIFSIFIFGVLLEWSSSFVKSTFIVQKS